MRTGEEPHEQVFRCQPWLLWREVFLLLLGAGLLLAQLLVPPISGLSDNGDYLKVTGRLGLGPTRDQFFYFVSDYWYSPRYYRPPDAPSLEVVPAWIARTLARANKPGAHFDLRYLSVIHALIFLAGLYFNLRLLRRITSPAVQIASALLFIWMFTDVMYVSYYNSFYTDTLGLLMLPLVVTSALYTIAETSLWIPLISFVIASSVFVTSKSQYTLCGIFPALFLILTSFGAQPHRRKVFSVLSSGVLLAVMVWQIRSVPIDYTAYSLFNVLLVKIAPKLPEPDRDMKLLGLTRDDLQYLGKHAYIQGVPIGQKEWQQQFVSRTGYGRVAKFYLHHPSRALSFMGRDLRTYAIHLRPVYLGNYRREDGFSGPAFARHFDSWSDIRARAYKIYPGHVVVWYLVFIGTAVVLIFRSHDPFIRKAAAVALGLALMGIMMFCFASLMDSEQTDRHLIMFHLITDMTIWMAITGAMSWAAPRGRLERGV